MFDSNTPNFDTAAYDSRWWHELYEQVKQLRHTPATPEQYLQMARVLESCLLEEKRVIVDQTARLRRLAGSSGVGHGEVSDRCDKGR